MPVPRGLRDDWLAFDAGQRVPPMRMRHTAVRVTLFVRVRPTDTSRCPRWRPQALSAREHAVRHV